MCDAVMDATPRLPMRLLDVFSGVGGFAAGLESSGEFRVAAFCEIIPFCRRVLASRWSGVPIYEDIRELSAGRLVSDGIAVDAICGGFPCQDISIAGAGRGIDGPRSGLWREMARLVRELRPRCVIVENVPALLHRGIGRVLGDLAALGYDAEWHCISAAACGLPHIRDRVWIIAYPNDVAGRLVDHLRHRVEVARAAAEKSWIGRSPAFWVNDWPTFPAVCGRNDGVPDALDRGRALGNAIVPAIPEMLGRSIHDSFIAAAGGPSRSTASAAASSHFTRSPGETSSTQSISQRIVS